MAVTIKHKETAQDADQKMLEQVAAHIYIRLASEKAVGKESAKAAATQAFDRAEAFVKEMQQRREA